MNDARSCAFCIRRVLGLGRLFTGFDFRQRCVNDIIVIYFQRLQRAHRRAYPGCPQMRRYENQHLGSLCSFIGMPENKVNTRHITQSWNTRYAMTLGRIKPPIITVCPSSTRADVVTEFLVRRCSTFSRLGTKRDSEMFISS